MNRLLKPLILTSLLGAAVAHANLPAPPVNNCPGFAKKTGWIKVLIADSILNSSTTGQASKTKAATTPESYDARVLQICQLAPNAEQIHLRVHAQSDSQTDLVNQVIALRKMYPDIQLGFHPNNDKGSQTVWGCPATAGWECVFSNSVNYMNQVNQALQAKGVKGFTIFSAEQSYLEPTATISVKQGSKYITKPNPEFAPLKSCLNGTAVQGVCIAANPGKIKYGYVGPSYGAKQEYGSSAYDFGYPQYYNLDGHAKFTGTYTWKLPISSLPEPNNPPDYGLTKTEYYMVDYDQSGAYKPQLPANSNGIYATVDTQLAASYLAFIIANRQFATALYPNGPGNGKVFITLSGQGSASGPFLGTKGWTIEKLNDFHRQLLTALSAYGILVAPEELQFGIWKFQPMLNNNFPVSNSAS